jgi:hypothetical protein
MKLPETAQEEIRTVFCDFVNELANLAKKYQPGYEAEFFKEELCNWALLLEEGYKDNAVLMCIQIANTIGQSQARKKGLPRLQDLEGDR